MHCITYIIDLYSAKSLNCYHLDRYFLLTIKHRSQYYYFHCQHHARWFGNSCISKQVQVTISNQSASKLLIIFVSIRNYLTTSPFATAYLKNHLIWLGMLFLLCFVVCVCFFLLQHINKEM